MPPSCMSVIIGDVTANISSLERWDISDRKSNEIISSSFDDEPEFCNLCIFLYFFLFLLNFFDNYQMSFVI